MNIALDKIPGLKKLAPFFRNNPKLAFAVIVSVIATLAFLFFTGSKETSKIRKSMQMVNSKKDANAANDKDVGVLIGQVDTKSYVSRVEKQYNDISAKFDSMTERIAALEKNASEANKSQAALSKIIIELDKRVIGKLEGVDSIKNNFGQGAGTSEKIFGKPLSMAQAAKQPLNNLEMAKVGEIKKEEKPKERSVYLPLGSFVK